MGKVIVKHIRNLGWGVRAGIVALCTVLATVGLWQGVRLVREAQAAVAVQTQWALLGAGSTSSLPAMSLAKGGGSNRLLVVKVVADYSYATSTFSPTVSYGGQTLTKIVATDTSSRQKVWFGYLKEAGISAATGSAPAITVSWNSAPQSGCGLSAAFYSNVDQGSPITGSRAVASDTSASTPSSGTISVSAGGWAIYGSNLNSAITSSVASGYTEHFDTANGSLYEDAVASKQISATGTENPLPTWSSTRYGFAVVGLRPATTTLGNGVVGSTGNVAPGASAQKLDGFSLVTGSAGTTDSVSGLTVTTTNNAAIASMQIWNEAGTTQYFGTVTNPGSDTWNFSGGTPIPVSSSAANYKIVVNFQTRAAGAPGGNTATSARVSALTSGNVVAGSDTADTTLTLINTHNRTLWGNTSTGDSKVILNWSYGTAGQSVVVVRYTAKTDTSKPVDGTLYTVGGSFGSGGTVRYVGTASTFTDTSVVNGATYYYKIFEYDSYLNYYNATDEWSPALTPLSPDTVAPTVSAGFSAATPVNTLTVSIAGLSATDNAGGSGVAGYLITTSATPPSAAASGWTSAPPTSFTVAAPGSYTLYPWAKDGGNNVSAVYGAPVTVLVDTTLPSVTAFSVPTQVASRTVPVSAFSGSDSGGSGIAGYLVTTTSAAPAASDPNWTSAAPASLAVAGDGNYALYPWVKDRAGNVSALAAAAAVLVDTTAPAGLAASAPADEATGIPVTAALQASAASDAGVGGVLYRFQITDNVAYTRDSGWIAAATWAPAGLVQGSTYVWTVQAKDALGNLSAATTPRSFTTTAPCVRNNPTLTLLTPGGGIASTVTADGGTAVFNLKVYNNDYGDCGSTTFNLSTVDTDLLHVFSPSGIAQPALTLAPGKSAATTVTVQAISGEDSGVEKTRVVSAADTYHSAVSTGEVQTTLNVVTCKPRTPLLIVGPDSGYLNRAGQMSYTVTVKNTDVGAGCAPVTFNLANALDSNAGDFNASQLSVSSLVLNAGQLGSAKLTVSAKATAVKNAVDLTTLALSAAGHSAPASVTVRTTVNNPMLHNSDNTNSAKWAASGGWGIPGGKYGEFVCQTCHLGGGGDTSNVKRVTGSITTPDRSKGTLPGEGAPVAFRRYQGNKPSDPVLGWDGGATPRAGSTNICEACHSYDATGANGTKVHPFATSQTLTNHQHGDGTDCTRCHKHSKGFGLGDMTCDTCHGNPPSEAPVAGMHGVHTALPNFQGCRACHLGGMLSQYVSNGVTDISFFAFSSTGGNYDGRTGVAYSAGNTNGGSQTCSNVYCHGGTMGTNGGSNRTPGWNSASTGTCGTCHGASAANPPTLGSHLKHAGAAGLALACSDCHAGLVPAGIPANMTTHVDGKSQVSLDLSKGYMGSGGSYSGTDKMLDAYGSCNVYCHSTGLNANSPTFAPKQWGTGSLACNGCHGDKSLTPIATGSHAKHLASANCADCHNLTVSSGSTTLAGTGYHVNRSVDIAFAAGNAVGTASYDGNAAPLAKSSTGSFGACSNVACHSDGTGIFTGSVQPKLTPTWGTSGGCGSCHGNTTYGDYRKAAPLYASGAPKRNAHDLHIQAGALSSHDVECKYCHATAVNATNDAVSAPHRDGSYTVAGGGASYAFEDGDNITSTHAAKVSTTLSYTYNDASHGGDATCSNVSCHPTGLAGSKSASNTAWNNKADCTDCHKVNLQNSTGYHHAMRNYSGGGAGYPSTIPGASAGANDNSRRCTMCHVDHNIFSPDLNAGNALGASANLRTGITDAVSKVAGYANSDFDSKAAGSGGICISCHNNELYKDSAGLRVKNEASSTVTVAVTLKGYSSSAHEYAVASAMRRDGKSFSSNCSKCHNGRVGEVAVFSSMTTAVHDSPVPRLYATLGYQDGTDANFCFRCHSTISNGLPGTKKPADGYDYYRTATMSAAAQGIYSAARRGTGSTAGPSTAASTLYMRNNVAPAWWTIPAKPSAYLLSSGTYTGTTTLTQRPLDTASGATQETRVQTSGTTSGNYLRYVQFVTPTLASSYSLANGATIQIKYRVGVSAAAAVQTRFQVYQRSAGGVNTPLSSAVKVDTVNWPTTAANRTFNFTTTSAVTLNAGDCLVVEMEAVQTNTTSASATLYWGSYASDTGSIVLPSAATFVTGPGTPASGRHDVNNPAYTLVHKPSPTDETFAYISANKHVSCNDCHSPHQAKAGNHTQGSGVLAAVLRGATGVATPTWPALWTAPAQSAYGTAPTAATAEWQICFKCHSGANSNVTTWGGTGSAAWTDLGLEFNPNNNAYHPVIQALPASGTKRQLASTALTGGWTPGKLMTCTDCHDSNSAVSRGPHGSGVKWMLNPKTTGTKYYNWPFTSAAANGTATGGTLLSGNGSSTAPNSGQIFCLSCHVWSGGGAAHTQQGGSHSVSCVSCHIRVPHGGKVYRLLTGANAPARYKPDGQGGGTVNVTGVTPPTTGTVGENACYTSCGHHNSTGYTQGW